MSMAVAQVWSTSGLREKSPVFEIEVLITILLLIPIAITLSANTNNTPVRLPEGYGEQYHWESRQQPS